MSSKIVILNTNFMRKKKKKDSDITKQTISSYVHFGKQNQFGHEKTLLNFSSNISKNIKNSVVYCSSIFYFFKNNIITSVLDNLYYVDDYQSLVEVTLNCYQNYYDLYTANKLIIKQNNKIIYDYLKPILETIFLTNDNFYQTKAYLTSKLLKNKNIQHINDCNNVCFYNIINNIFKSFYSRNFHRVEELMLNHQKIEILGCDERFINQVKNNNNLFTNGDVETETEYTINKNKLYEKLKDGITKEEWNKYTQASIIKQFTYRHLHNNTDKLSSDLKNSIIRKAMESIDSFFALKSKGIKCNYPKYSGKNEQYVLRFYRNKGFKIKHNENKIELTFGDYIGEHLLDLLKDANINTNIIKEDDEYSLLSGESSASIGKNKYSCNGTTFEGHKLVIHLPKKLQNKEIMLIEIQPLYDKDFFKINYTYNTTDVSTNLDKLIESINDDEIIAIDLGMANLAMIYDPSGKACTQKIISGAYINALNFYYNRLIDELKSKCAKLNGVQTTKRIRSLLIKREQLIDRYFNILTRWFIKTYSHKKTIVIGYNKEWKKGINIGKKNNRSFYQIPFSNLLDKLEYAFSKIGIKVVITNEAYTSKCDALGLEEVCHHEKYMGKRIGRGLFRSVSGKLINADLNGAINIYRKYLKKKNIDYTRIKGNGLFNPIKVNIFKEML